MHKDVIWFDTAGCFENNGHSGFISQINNVTFMPSSPWFPTGSWMSWFQGTKDKPTPLRDGVTDWSTDIKVLDPTSSIGYADEDLYKNLLSMYLDIVDDCDVDC